MTQVVDGSIFFLYYEIKILVLREYLNYKKVNGHENHRDNERGESWEYQ